MHNYSMGKMRLTMPFLCIILSLFSPLAQAGGPWLAYDFTMNGKSGGVWLLNLAYDNGPQFTFSENDPDQHSSISTDPKAKTIWRTISTVQDSWNRMSWGRQGNTFGVLYSQYEVIPSWGTADSGLFFGTGSCVSWPNRGKSIGITGLYPKTINCQHLRIDGGWQGGSPLNNGSRYVRQYTFKLGLLQELTAALNAARESLATNQDAKEWTLNYYVNQLKYRALPDVHER